VDDVVRAARDLEAGCIEPDTSLSAEENVELLLRATRLLQLGLEVQFTEAEGLLSENNGLRDDLRVSKRQKCQKHLACKAQGLVAGGMQTQHMHQLQQTSPYERQHQPHHAVLTVTAAAEN
jgi:hypothetical protein